MAAIPLPELDIQRLKMRLYHQFKVEVPVYRWQGRAFLRVSVQGYTTQQDLDALEAGLSELLPQEVAE